MSWRIGAHFSCNDPQYLSIDISTYIGNQYDSTTKASIVQTLAQEAHSPVEEDDHNPATARRC